MTELTDFYYDGNGWVCRRCEDEIAADVDLILTESALAKWIDNTHRVLICPRCGIIESVEKF